MFKWIFNSLYLEHQETLFIISIIVIILIIAITFYFVLKELKNNHVNK